MSTAHHGSDPHLGSVRQHGSETKASYKTSEFIAFVVMVIGILIASAVADGPSVMEDSNNRLFDGHGHGFSAQDAWKFITFLTVGYMISRGLAKSGTRANVPDDAERAEGRRRADPPVA